MNNGPMNNPPKKRLVMWNTILWFVAMVLPAALSFAFASARFPWQVALPLLLTGCLLASNRLLALAMGQSADGANPKSTDG